MASNAVMWYDAGKSKSRSKQVVTYFKKSKRFSAKRKANNLKDLSGNGRVLQALEKKWLIDSKENCQNSQHLSPTKEKSGPLMITPIDKENIDTNFNAIASDARKGFKCLSAKNTVIETVSMELTKAIPYTPAIIIGQEAKSLQNLTWEPSPEDATSQPLTSTPILKDAPETLGQDSVLPDLSSIPICKDQQDINDVPKSFPPEKEECPQPKKHNNSKPLEVLKEQNTHAELLDFSPLPLESSKQIFEQDKQSTELKRSDDTDVTPEQPNSLLKPRRDRSCGRKLQLLCKTPSHKEEDVDNPTIDDCCFLLSTPKGKRKLGKVRMIKNFIKYKKHEMRKLPRDILARN